MTYMILRSKVFTIKKPQKVKADTAQVKTTKMSKTGLKDHITGTEYRTFLQDIAFA